MPLLSRHADRPEGQHEAARGPDAQEDERVRVQVLRALRGHVRRTPPQVRGPHRDQDRRRNDAEDDLDEDDDGYRGCGSAPRLVAEHLRGLDLLANILTRKIPPFDFEIAQVLLQTISFEGIINQIKHGSTSRSDFFDLL